MEQMAVRKAKASQPHDTDNRDPATCDTNTYDPEEAGVREARGQEARVQEA